MLKKSEKILKDEVVSLVDCKLDPLQVAYQAGKSVEDAKFFMLNTLYKD